MTSLPTAIPLSAPIALPLTQPVAIFLMVLVIILCAPLVFKRLKIPQIVVLIAAGMAVGPYGFNLLERDASFTIFGQVGILYLMFLAAIEIDMYHMRQNARPGILFGMLTFLLPFGAGIAVMRVMFSASWCTSVLVASMISSHTLVSYPTVSRFGLSNNRGAVIAVCGTIVAVLLSLLALAEVVDVDNTGSFSMRSLGVTLLFTAAYTLAVGFSFPPLTRWFFRRVADPVIQYIFILAEVLLASLLAGFIGLEAILGAFYAGLVLNRFIPTRSALMKNISFVGNAIFIPYFLIGVGMLINVRAIFEGWNTLTLAAVMTTTALTTKGLSAWSATRFFRLNRDERTLLFGLTSGKAAATIAATMIGYQHGLLSEDMMNGAVIMILICCIAASVATERGAKRLRLALASEELTSDISHTPGFARQVVAVSNPLTAEGLVKAAVFMRNPDNREAMTMLFVRSSDDRRRESMGRNALSTAVKAADSMDIPVEEVERYDLNVATGLSNTMHERHATDILIGMHVKSNIVDSFFGTMTETLLDKTDKMVILARCFMPVDTMRKLVVYLPRNCQYEAGFYPMLARVCNLASQIGARVVFFCYPDAREHIENFIADEEFSCNRDYKQMENWDDFIILSSQVGEEDLLIITGARKGSLSYGADMDNMPSYLSRHFNRHNLMMIYPAQYAASAAAGATNK